MKIERCAKLGTLLSVPVQIPKQRSGRLRLGAHQQVLRIRGEVGKWRGLGSPGVNQRGHDVMPSDGQVEASRHRAAYHSVRPR